MKPRKWERNTIPKIRGESPAPPPFYATVSSARDMASEPQPEIAAPLFELRQLRVEPVTDIAGRRLWKALVD